MPCGSLRFWVGDFEHAFFDPGCVMLLAVRLPKARVFSERALLDPGCVWLLAVRHPTVPYVHVPSFDGAS